MASKTVSYLAELYLSCMISVLIPKMTSSLDIIPGFCSVLRSEVQIDLKRACLAAVASFDSDEDTNASENTPKLQRSSVIKYCTRLIPRDFRFTS